MLNERTNKQTKAQRDALDAKRWQAFQRFLAGTHGVEVDTMNIGEGKRMRLARNADNTVTVTLI